MVVLLNNVKGWKMRSLLFTALAVLFCNDVMAVDIGCHGKVVWLMADHSGCTDANGKRQMAFKTVSSSNPWMCARTEMGSSMLLATKAAGKEVNVYISDQGQGYSCSTIPHYSKVSYLILVE